MYKIIGVDQREYGPVAVEQIRQWIAEGRANGATLVQPEGRTDWVPISSLPEFAEALSNQPLPPMAPSSPPPSGTRPPDVPITDRYEIDIGRCVGRSWALFKENAGLLIGATVIILVVIVVLNQIMTVVTRGSMQSLLSGNLAPGPILVMLLANIPEMAVSAVMTGGLYGLFLKLIRGQPAGIGDLFAPLSSSALQLAVAGIVVQILTLVGILACIVPGVYLSVAWILTGPLIVDRQLDFWSAMELSRKVVTRQWWVMFCLLVVVALISLVGVLACCVGVIVSVPIGLGALMYAYEDIFSGPGTTSA